jgi:DNA repair exonuclease SbcCD nuclease subunit
LFTFVHAADIHLDSPLRGLERYEGAPVAELRGATRKALENLVQLSIDQAVAFVVIAGDVYDGDWKDYNTGLFFARQMTRLREAGIKVFLIRGNHDAASQITRELTLPENVREFSTRTPESIVLDQFGVVIHGQSFLTQAVTENLAANYPLAHQNHFNIGVLHTSAGGREGHENYAPCTIDCLLSRGYDYWALGHVHQREELHRDPWIVFSGNTQGRHIREVGCKGCTLVTVDDGIISSVDHRPLDIARWTRCLVSADGAADIDELLESTRQALLDALNTADDRLVATRLVVSGACPAHKQLATKQEQFVNECRALANDLGGGRIWIEQVQLQTRSDLNFDELATRMDPLGDLVRFSRALPANEDALQSLLAEFSTFRQKLPLELRQGADAIDFDDPALLKNLLPEVEQILLPRLLDSEPTR